MPLLSRRFGKKSRRTRSSPHDRDRVSLHTPRTTASTPYDCTPSPSRSPSPSFSEPSQLLSPYFSRLPSPSQADELWRVLDAPSMANLASSVEAFNPDIHSPNDMLVDTEEHIVEPSANGDEKDNLTIINPDNLETEEAEQPPQDLPRADDRTLPK